MKKTLVEKKNNVKKRYTGAPERVGNIMKSDLFFFWAGGGNGTKIFPIPLRPADAYLHTVYPT